VQTKPAPSDAERERQMRAFAPRLGGEAKVGGRARRRRRRRKKRDACCARAWSSSAQSC
jgi:hypothetical protein